MNSKVSEATWEGTNLDASKWKEFLDGDVWRAFLFELESREKYLIELFKEGDKEWSPDVLRGKLTEIDFIKQIPVLILVSINDTILKDKEKPNVEQDGRGAA